LYEASFGSRKRRQPRRFSGAFKELMRGQGEIALVVELDSRNKTSVQGSSP
jgi:hypothetical protein